MWRSSLFTWHIVQQWLRKLCMVHYQTWTSDLKSSNSFRPLVQTGTPFVQTPFLLQTVVFVPTVADYEIQTPFCPLSSKLASTKLIPWWLVNVQQPNGRCLGSTWSLRGICRAMKSGYPATILSILLICQQCKHSPFISKALFTAYSRVKTVEWWLSLVRPFRRVHNQECSQT